MLPPELIVTIENVGEHKYLAKTTRPDGDEICNQTFDYDPDYLIDLEPQWMLERPAPRAHLDPVVRQEDETGTAPTEAGKLANYGRRLYGFLFGDGQALNAFLRFNDQYRRQARLTLKMHPNAAVLWRLPWEYLHDGSDFLTLHGRFLLSRMPYGLGQMEPPETPLPLRILVVIAAPDDQATLDTEEEIGVIQAALDEAVRSNRVQVEYLDDATLPAIGDRVRRFRPHVLHYTGHGLYDKQQGRSFLALEQEDGRTHRAGIAELRPYLRQATDLRLVFLSGCQTAQASPEDAFSGVATGLLQSDIPAVLAMQFSILDLSATELARAFYAALVQGETLAGAMQQARLALRHFADGPGYDWGVSALYLRAQGLRLVDPDAQPAEPPAGPARLLDMAGLPLPPHFVGRKQELRRLRRAWRDRHIKAAFIRGIGGVGKSSIAAKFLERPGQPIDAALVIRCHQVDPLDIPGKLASFLAGQGQANHAEAAGLLLDSRLPPADRARQAAALLAGRRYVFVFDNFESLMFPSPDLGEGLGEGVDSAFPLADPTLDGLLSGLLQANWRSLCLFTGRFRWQALEEHLGRDTALELHLPQLRLREAIMLMDNLPRLRPEPLRTKIALYHKIGGHPKSIELLNGWLATGRLTDLLADPSLDDRLASQWEAYFLAELLAFVPPAEQDRLTRLSIFPTRLDQEEFDYAGVAPATLRRWLDLSLLQREEAAYTLHPVVREYLLGRLDQAGQRALHTWAATLRGRPFVETARAFAAQSGQSWAEEEIENLARDYGGVVGHWVRDTGDLAQARAAMARALEWQRHLFAAGAYEAADDIVNAVWAILDRWGERDRAKALLRGSIETLDGGNKAVAQGNLATLLIDEGNLAEALDTYPAVYHTFEALEAKQQMAGVLHQQSIVLSQMGRYDQAIAKAEQSLALQRERGDEAGQAISLHQLAMCHRYKEDYPTALARSREAEEIDRRRGDQAGLATDLHQQGLIYNDMARAAQAEAGAEAHRRAAVERFQESLTIKRRIGNEAGAADSLGELGKLRQDAGQMGEAVAAFNEALEIYRRTNNPAKMGIVLELLGIVHERQGHYPAALEKYQQALELKRKYMAPQNVALTEANIARVQQKIQEEGG